MEDPTTHVSKPAPAGDAASAVHPLIEPTLFYDPPYERPIEDEFAWHLVKYLNPVSALGYQVRVETPCAPFWVDFVAEQGARRVGFECGLSEGDEEERLRDALVVGSGAIDVLYRFRGDDLVHRLHDCLYVASRWDRELFSPRAHVNLHTLASPEARASRPSAGDEVVRLAYGGRKEADSLEGEAFTWPAGAPQVLRVRRLARTHPAAWMHDYDEALARFGLPGESLRKTA